MKSKIIFIFIFSCCLNSYLYGQNFPETAEGKGFDSIFQNLKEGAFHGKASGELRIVNLSGDTVKISFDKDNALLQIIPDPDEVYDVSRKVYSCASKKDMATFKYSTYAHANEINLILKGKDYGMNLIDGDCYSVFKNLDYAYKQKDKLEELDLCFTGNIEMSFPPSHIGPGIIILKGSRLTFTIEMPKADK